MATADQLMQLELGALAGLSTTEISRIVNFKIPKVILVELPEYVTEGDGDLPGEGGVGVPKAPASDLVITLSSSSPTDLTVPSTVTIPAGQTTAAFDLTVPEDVLLDGAHTVTVTATAEGYYSGSDTLRVHDNEFATLIVDLPASATEDGGVLAGQGSVTVSSLVDSSVRVDLSSSDEDVVRVPATVLIPAGRDSAAFDLMIVDDAKIDGTRTAIITAAVPGWTAGNDAISVSDNDAFLTLSVPALAKEGEGQLMNAGRISIIDTLDANLIIELSSDDPSKVTVPATVTIPTGETSVSFDVTIIDDPAIDGIQTVTITATAADFTADSEDIAVVDNDNENETPAVNEEFVYAYTGPYSKGLTVINRQTGVKAFNIPDPNFAWNSYRMKLAPVLGSANNVIVIQGGRLISFDLDKRAIGWEIQDNFTGQPSLASGRLYAISSGALSVRNESDGALRWTWSPPNGSLSGTMIATDSHILAGTDTATYAIDLNTRTQVWSYPAGGKLALSEGILYIATDSGTLVAIDTGIDSDNDGIPDQIEETTCTDPYDADTDNDGISDGAEDADQNGVVDPGEIDPCTDDTDGDDLPDGWEIDNGLDPLDSSGVNGRDGDFDSDGWTNYEEYLLGSDPDNRNDPQPSPPVIIETIPHQGAGIDPDTTRVANNTSFAVYIEDADGIDVTDPASISFSIDDGQTVYNVDLDNTLELVCGF